jgi:predicted RNA binding protein YcfA (HicA-like mRNA interferase family)
MAKLPSLHYRRVVKAFQAHGWQVARQTSSHIIMVHEGQDITLSVPAHNPVAKGTLGA